MASPSDADIKQVFEAWRGRQRSPDRVKLRESRRKLIRDRLSHGYDADELVSLIAYAYEADTAEAKFWRGENTDRRTYLGLDNLFRVGKLADRVDRALDWTEAPPAGEDNKTNFVGDLLRQTRRRRE